MSTLNLIGNGFDLYHGLPCSYYYFGCYLIDNHPDFYEELAKMYGFKCYKFNSRYEDFDFVVENNLFWSHFEERLGELDSTWLEESLQDDLGLEYPDDAVDLDIPETTNSETIKRYFTEWVLNTLETSKCMNLVKKSLGNKKIHLNNTDFYINFNYTSVLENVYGIDEKQVFHIHGKAGEVYSNLVVGHGNTDIIKKLDSKISDILSETYYLSVQEVRNRLNEYEAEKEILQNLYKDTKFNILSMDDELRNKEIEDIYIWGLSCGSVDLPYIEHLKLKYPNTKWHFSYFDNLEKEDREKLSKELNIENDKVSFFEFRNNDAKNTKNRIVEKLGIKEYTCV